MSAPAVTAVEPLWLKNARQLLGLKEIVGSKHEPKVVQFFAEAGHPEIHNDETAWCAAFANAMLRRAGKAGTGALNARSFLNWGTKLTEPKPGCIVVFKRGNTTWQGHVGFVVSATAKQLKVLGGNQGNAVSIQSFNRDASVLGYRWPLIKSAPAATPPTKTATAVKTGAGLATGGIVAKTVDHGVKTGWGFTEWALLILALAVAAGAAYAAWRWWQARSAREVSKDAVSTPLPVLTASIKATSPKAKKAAKKKKTAARKRAA